jgi:hypothetical protein
MNKKRRRRETVKKKKPGERKGREFLQFYSLC